MQQGSFCKVRKGEHINPNGQVGIELDRIALGEKEVVAKEFAKGGEMGAQRGAGLLVGIITPQQGGEFLGGVGLWGEQKKGEKGFEFVARQDNDFVFAFDAETAEHVYAQCRRERGAWRATHLENDTTVKKGL